LKRRRKVKRTSTGLKKDRTRRRGLPTRGLRTKSECKVKH